MAYSKRVKNGWRFEVARNGIRKSRTFKTKAEGDLWSASEEAEILAVKRGALPRKTFRETLERYRDEISPRKKGGPAEVKRINAFLREFRHLAEMQLGAVDGSHLAAWRDARLKIVTPGSVQRDVNVFSNVFTVARDEWRWIRDSPFRGFKAPGDNPARTARVDMGDARRILRRLGHVTGQTPRTKSAEIALAFLVSLRTAMRAGEILSLTAARIDAQRRVALVPHKTEHITGRPRPVPLSKHGLRLLRHFDAGFVWTVSAASMSALFHKACKSLLIENLHFHDARADALTRFARKVDVMTLAKISGHRDLRILLNVYYRITPAEIADRLDLPTPSLRRRPNGASFGSPPPLGPGSLDA